MNSKPLVVIVDTEPTTFSSMVKALSPLYRICKVNSDEKPSLLVLKKQALIQKKSFLYIFLPGAYWLLPERVRGV